MDKINATQTTNVASKTDAEKGVNVMEVTSVSEVTEAKAQDAAVNAVAESAEAKTKPGKKPGRKPGSKNKPKTTASKGAKGGTKGTRGKAVAKDAALEAPDAAGAANRKKREEGLYIEFKDNSKASVSEIWERAWAAYGGNKRSRGVHEFNVYVNAEQKMVYVVVNGEQAVKFEV